MISTKSVDIYTLRNVGTLVVPFVQFESGWNLQFKFQDLTIPSGSTAQIFIRKPSGLIVYNNCTVNAAGGTVTAPITNQTLAEAGNASAQVQVRNGDDMVSSFTVVLKVERSAADDEAEESQSESDIFKQAAEAAAAAAAEYFEIDDTLTQTGKAADAKAAGDAIALATLTFTDPYNDGNIVITRGGA